MADSPPALMSESIPTSPGFLTKKKIRFFFSLQEKYTDYPIYKYMDVELDDHTCPFQLEVFCELWNKGCR